eukprot:UN27529
MEIQWMSQASAAQRAGRSGRTGPGHTYRLYSSAVYDNHFYEHTKPQILSEPIENIILSMKNMNINNILQFPFPTCPSRESLQKGEKILQYLGALESTENKLITPIGKKLCVFPIGVRFAKNVAIEQSRKLFKIYDGYSCRNDS